MTQLNFIIESAYTLEGSQAVMGVWVNGRVNDWNNAGLVFRALKSGGA
jgi:hypothetical protein